MKVIIDTNIWISYLIGKTLAGLSKLLENDKVEIIVSDKIIDELKDSILKNRLEKYFKGKDFSSFFIELSKNSFELFDNMGISICRDDDDNHLLALAKKSNADYIITGDKDLLDINKFEKTRIIRFREALELFGDNDE